MFKKIRAASKIFRNSYGQIRGFLLWMELFKEKLLIRNQVFSVHVPNIAHPVWLRAHTSDVEVFCQIFGHCEMDFYRKKDAKFIIDAGANIGLTSVFLGNRCPNACIYSLEVDSGNFEILQRNIAPYPKITGIKMGLWGSSGFIRILNSEASSWAFTVGETTIDDPFAIPAICIPDLMLMNEYNKIDLLKIDIEGSEVDVFGSDVNEWLNAVNVLAVELHDRFQPGCTDVVDSAVSKRSFRRMQSGEYNIFEFHD